MKGICRGRAAIGRGGLEPPGPAFADQRVTFPGNRGGSGGSGASPGLSRGVFQDGLSPTSLSERGELDLVFHFLGSAFGTAGWLRPRRAPDSHLGETDKGRIFCQQNPAQLPWNRAGRGGGALWRKDREIHLLPMERRGEGGRSGADPELQWRNSSVFCRGNHRMSWVGRDPEGSGPRHVSASPPWLVPRAPSPGMRL